MELIRKEEYKYVYILYRKNWITDYKYKYKKYKRKQKSELHMEVQEYLNGIYNNYNRGKD